MATAGPIAWLVSQLLRSERAGEGDDETARIVVSDTRRRPAKRYWKEGQILSQSSDT
jgi:hypothetical protein